MKRPLSFLLFGLLSLLLRAQNPDPLIYTVGQAYPTDGGSSQHDFLLWQPGDIAVTLDKSFAVYVKPGPASSASPYQRVAVQKLRTGPTAILAALKLGDKVDHEAAKVASRILMLRAEVFGQPVTPPPAQDVNLPNAAAALAEIIDAAKGNAETLQSLISLGRAHPGVMISLGHAYACQVSPAARHTYEVRQLDPTGQDLRVIGRVTIDGANPRPLLAPGEPIVISHTDEEINTGEQRLNKMQLVASAKDHLNARFRWGLNDAFRRDFPRTYGFNLYRVPTGSFSMTTPESITTEDTLLALTDAVKVNELPIPASTLLTLTEAADLSVQPKEFFYADDKNPPSDPFEDGESFYYYVAARDIAGHPGPLSPPTEVTMCDRLPPTTPSIHAVENVYDFAGGTPETGSGQQHLRVVIRQTPEDPAENRAAKYFVYRWHRADDWLRHGGDRTFNLIGMVDHVEGETFITFDDNDASDLDTDDNGPSDNGPDTGAAVANSETDDMMGKTVWYTVRAVDNASCNPPNFSGHSGAVYGVLRDRKGPDRPDGSITTCYCIPRVQVTPLLFRPKPEPTQGGGDNPATGVGDINDPGFLERLINDTDNGEGLFIIARTQTDADGNSTLQPKIKGFQLQVDNDEDSVQERLVYYDRFFLFEDRELFKVVRTPGPMNTAQRVRLRACLTNGVLSDWITYTAQFSQDLDPANYFTVAYGLLSAEIRKVTSPGPFGGPLPHDYTDGSGVKLGVPVHVIPPADAREIRIYRRAGIGQPLQLIDKIVGDSLPNPYDFTDNSLPPAHGTEICYYAMAFDEHANASALVTLGCLQIDGDPLAQPVLTEPECLGTGVDGDEFRLTWTCDPVGVDHFEVWAAIESQASPGVTGDELSLAQTTPVPLVLAGASGALLNFTKYETPRISSGFGEDGLFSLVVTIPTGKTVSFYVRAAGVPIQQSPTTWTDNTGDFSDLGVALYKPKPTGPIDVIPWPARQLPPVSEIARQIGEFQPGNGPFYAHPIPRAIMPGTRASTAILIGSYAGAVSNDQTSPDPTQQNPGGSFNGITGGLGSYLGKADPMDFLFPLPKGTGPDGEEKSAGPFALYRHQVPSTLFQNAKPDLVQCTPLIDRIAYQEIQLGDRDFRLIRDPFVFSVGPTDYGPAGLQVPFSGAFSRDPKVPSELSLVTPDSVASLPFYLQQLESDGDTVLPISLWLKDPLPVTKGARYQYLLVHFDERGEICRITPTNLVQH